MQIGHDGGDPGPHAAVAAEAATLAQRLLHPVLHQILGPVA
jgi:hypothetical protein